MEQANPVFLKEPYEAKDIFTYGDAYEFAYHVFNTFNGRVNPHFIASSLIFSFDRSDNQNVVYGCNTCDLVEVNIHDILADAAAAPFAGHPSTVWRGRREAVKGIILYCIIHELLHLEQDMAVYENQYGKDAMLAIETSCHKMTDELVARIMDSGVLSMDMYGDLSSNIPSLENFVPLYEPNNPDAMKKFQYYSNFYPLKSPEAKCYWIVNTIINSADNEFDLAYFLTGESGFNNLMISIMMGDRVVTQGFIVYMNRLVHPREICRILVPASMYMMKTQYKHIGIENLHNKDLDTYMIILHMPNDYRFLEIVDRLPPNVRPVPPFYPYR